MFYLYYLIFVTLIQVVLYGYYRMFLSRETWFRFNRFYLLGILILSAFLPIARWSFLPALEFPTVYEWVTYSLEPVLITATGRGAAPQIYWPQIAWNIYLTGIIAALGLFLYRVQSLWTYIRQLDIQEKTPFYTLMYTGGQLPTSSFFRYIFWDETQEFSETEKQQILDHECTHIQQGHSWDLLLVEFFQIVLWFHPMVYLIRQDLIKVHEFQADRIASNKQGKHSYVQLILRDVMGLSIPLTHSFFESPALSRIRMLDQIPDMERALRKYLPAIPVLGVLILLYRVDPAVTVSGRLAEVEKKEMLMKMEHIRSQDQLRALQEKVESLKQQNNTGEKIQPDPPLRQAQEKTSVQVVREPVPNVAPSGSHFGDSTRVVATISGRAPMAAPTSDAGARQAPASPSVELDVSSFIEADEQPAPLNMMEIRQTIGYPQLARSAGIEGNVVVRLLVDEAGEYQRHVVLNGVHPVLEEAVTEQIPKLRFSPARKDGKAIKFWVNIPFAFRLVQ